MKNKRTRANGDVRREQIVQAVFGIIVRQGVGSVTTAAIAQEVGISEPAIYRHFKNKEAVLHAAVEQIGAGLAKNVEKVLSATRVSPMKKLKKLFLLHLDYIEKHAGIPRLVYSEEVHVRNQRLKEKLLFSIGAYASRIEALLREGKSAGVVRKDVDTAASALMFIGLVQIMALRWSLSGFSFELVKEGGRLWKNYERCISSPI